ncbi:MAG: AAA family ATPase [Verrucomicrobia bacterium]|nr:AAA family ATPase [Verrucomicrobiota bacterium]
MSSLPADDLAFRQWLAARLKPHETTQPGHPLYVPVNEGTDHDPVKKILRDIRLNDSKESLNLVSGFSGAGKSSELRRLRKTLADEGYDAFIADADEYFMPNGNVDIEVLLIKLAAAWCDQLDQSEDIDAAQQSYMLRFWHWLKKTDVALEGVDLGGSLSAGDSALAKAEINAKIKITLKENPALIQRVQDARTKRPGAIRAELILFFSEMIRALRDQKPSSLSPVLILDSFEKLSDTPQTAGSVAESICTLLTAHFDELSIKGIHVILTMPPWIKLRGLGQDRVRLLFGVKLWTNTPERERWADGYARMRAVVLKRFEAEGLQRFFGEAQDGSRPLVDALIYASGGHIRDLITLLYEALLEAADGPPPDGQPIVTEANVRRVIAEHRSNISRLSDEAARCLHEIAESRNCSFPDHGTQATLTLTGLYNSHRAFVLPNDGEWHDVHPLALDAVKEKVRRLKGEAAVPAAAPAVKRRSSKAKVKPTSSRGHKSR